MRLPLGLRIQNLFERVTGFAETVWLCKIKRQHHVKMGSHGHCYRCGRKPRA